MYFEWSETLRRATYLLLSYKIISSLCNKEVAVLAVYGNFIARILDLLKVHFYSEIHYEYIGCAARFSFIVVALKVESTQKRTISPHLYFFINFASAILRTYTFLFIFYSWNCVLSKSAARIVTNSLLVF